MPGQDEQCVLDRIPAFLWESGISEHAMQGVLTWPAPSKNPRQGASRGPASLATLLTCCHSSVLGELSMSCVTPQWEDSWNLAPGFLRTSPHAPLPFDFALCPFAEINFSHTYDYMLSFVSPSSKSPKLGVMLRAPKIST